MMVCVVRVSKVIRMRVIHIVNDVGNCYIGEIMGKIFYKVACSCLTLVRGIYWGNGIGCRSQLLSDRSCVSLRYCWSRFR